MKAKEFKELKSKDIVELTRQVLQLRQELTKLKMDLAAGKVKNIAGVGKYRRDIAQILTIIREKKEANG